MSPSVIKIIAALVDSGMEPAEAAALLALAAFDMTGERKSSAALRQQRYRERNKTSRRHAVQDEPGVTERNESVTRDAGDEASRTVTNRNESVTSLRQDEIRISYLLTSKEECLPKKVVSKKDAVKRKRNAPLRDDWTPNEHAYRVAEQHGVSVQIVEQIFRDYLKSSGKLYADYDAAFYNFLRNQNRFNGRNNHGTAQSKSGSSLTASIRRELQELEQSESSDFALPNGSIRLISG